jgi:hypothetical protein
MRRPPPFERLGRLVERELVGDDRIELESARRSQPDALGVVADERMSRPSGRHSGTDWHARPGKVPHHPHETAGSTSTRVPGCNGEPAGTVWIFPTISWPSTQGRCTRTSGLDDLQIAPAHADPTHPHRRQIRAGRLREVGNLDPARLEQPHRLYRSTCLAPEAAG